MPDTVLAGCYVISLRPAGQHEPLRRAAARHGARVLALSPWRLAPRDDAATRAALETALACAKLVATSPAAVRAAAALQPLQRSPGQVRFSVGNATAHALRRAGVAGVVAPRGVDGARADRALHVDPSLDDTRRDGARTGGARIESMRMAGAQADVIRNDGGLPGNARIDGISEHGIAGRSTPTDSVRMDSEGLLALPGLQDVRGTTIGLLTAPGGRGVIERVLEERGARLVRADVYARDPIVFTQRALDALRALQAPAWLALSSGEALARTLAQLPEDAAARLRAVRVVAASPRLAQLARDLGFTGVVVAASAQPRDLVAAIAREASASMRGIDDAAGPTA
jgi:uroporphyrinogen-III synthase